MKAKPKLGRRQLFILQRLEAEGGIMENGLLYASDRDVMLTLEWRGLVGFVPENEIQAYWQITDAGRAALDSEGDGR